MSKRKINQRASKTNYQSYFIGGVFLILFGILIGVIVSDISQPAGSSEVQSAPIVYSTDVLEIASEFICSCGSCGDLELVSCTCNTAIQEKNMIQDLLGRGYEKESIISTVETMFGKKKS